MSRGPKSEQDFRECGFVLGPKGWFKPSAKLNAATVMKSQTHSEALAVGVEANERAMHNTLENWLRLNDLSYVHSRTDRKSTIREGWPDYTVLKGNHVICIELKHGNGQLRPEQVEVIAELQNRGTPVLVTNSVVEAIEWIREQLLK